MAKCFWLRAIRVQQQLRLFPGCCPLLASQKGRVRKRNSTLLTRRSSMWKLPMGASDTEIDRLSRKHPTVLRSILLGVPMVHFWHWWYTYYYWIHCNTVTQYFSPWTDTFWCWQLLWVQPSIFHPEWACFDLYLHFDDNTALFTPDGYIFTHHLHWSND